MNNDTTPRPFTALAEDMPFISTKLDKLNKLAGRNGLPLATIEFGAIYEKTTTNDMGFDCTVRLVDGILHMPKMGLDGWTLVATLDHDAAGNMIRTAPGFDGDLPVEFRTSDAGRCDHCHTNRNRTQTIVVRHTDGTFAQVGGDCVKVYLGFNVESVLSIMTEMDNVGEEFGGFARPTGPTVSEFLAVTATVVSLYGYKSKAACEFGGTPTSSIVTELTGNNITRHTREAFPEFFALTNTARFDDADGERARKVIARSNALAIEATEWALALTGESDFDNNLRTAVARTTVGRNAGFLAYAVEGYRKATEQAAAKAAQAEMPASEYIGTVGAKVTLKGCTVLYTNRSEGYAYNSPDSLYVVLVAADGTKATMKTTVETAIGQLLEDATKADRFDVTGTVKEHKMYKGDKTNVLTRCKAIEVAS